MSLAMLKQMRGNLSDRLCLLPFFGRWETIEAYADGHATREALLSAWQSQNLLRHIGVAHPTIHFVPTTVRELAEAVTRRSRPWVRCTTHSSTPAGPTWPTTFKTWPNATRKADSLWIF